MKKNIILKSEMEIERLRQLLTNKEIKPEYDDELIILKLCLDNNDFFEKEWCISYPNN